MRVSFQQVSIGELVCGEINYKIGKRYIDIALPERSIAIEYDSWYWHGNRQEEDLRRARELIDMGWRVLSIKSRKKIPSKDEILKCLKELDSKSYTELVLDDWKKGTTADEVMHPRL